MQGLRLRRARIAARLALAGALLCLVASVGMHVGSRAAEAAPGGSVGMSPGNSSINPGDDISITFDVIGGVNVHRVLIVVTYNPVVVAVVDANSGAAGTQILPGAFPGTTVIGNVLQNDAAAGTITYEYALNSPAAQASGSGTVATALFHAIGTGNANLQWAAKTFTDGAAVNSTPPGNAAVLAVGQAVNTSTLTPTGTATETPTPTDTPPPAPTGTATDTPTPGPSATPGTVETTGTPQSTTTTIGSVTSSPTRTVTGTPSPAPSAVRTSTNTVVAAATSTARITIVDNSNKEKPPQGGVDPAQSSRANGLPSAGQAAPGIKWWRWMFFLAAIMLGVAGWFFTFALHYGDKEPILVDRGDRRRKRRY